MKLVLVFLPFCERQVAILAKCFGSHLTKQFENGSLLSVGKLGREDYPRGFHQDIPLRGRD